MRNACVVRVGLGFVVALAMTAGCAAPPGPALSAGPEQVAGQEAAAEAPAGAGPGAAGVSGAAGAAVPVVPVMIDSTCEEAAVPAPFDAITIRQQRGDDCFSATDAFELRVQPKEGEAVDFEFTSTYGGFQLHVIPALAGGEAILCLRTGAGRGTEVRSETLRVFRLKDGALRRVLTVPLGAWKYVEENVPQNAYEESSWAVADVDRDGTAEVLVSPSNPHTWTTKDCDVYRWSEERGLFFKKR